MAEPVNSREVPDAERLAENLERPALDDRSYRVIRLPNKLEALLIHDPETDKVSGALDVNVGSFSDLEDMPGIAHAVEHLLFMGTKKYPQENAYNQYLTAHSGYSNAFTASTSTNYYFEVAANAGSTEKETTANGPRQEIPSKESESPLYGALDRFAQFFVAPLFLEETLDRELKAVDSENKKNLQSDSWRLHQLNKTLSNPKHPFRHFSTGSYETLHDEPLARGVRIRDEFMKFYREHYSANLMKLVVLGRESLDELESWVKELFSGVVNKDLPRNRWDDAAPFTEKELKTQVFAKPVLDSRKLELYFPYQDEEEMYSSQPGRYLSHLIGHEGPGSILAYIKAKGWADSLGSGQLPLCPGAAFFTISIRLTEDGLKNYREIVKIVFQYISMLRESAPQEWVVDELKRMSEVDFKFKQKSPASRTTSSLSGIMQKPFRREWLLSGPALIREFNPEAINNGLSYLRPDNFRLTIISQTFPGDWDQKEKWYGTEYKYEKVPGDFLQEIEKAFLAPANERPSELHLPHKNEFIPTRLDVEKKEVQEPLKTPKLIRNDENVRTWFKKDDRFWVPKANIHIILRSPLAKVTTDTAVMTQLYRALVQDALVEYSYDAEIAGLDYAITEYAIGMDITVRGYNDKMAVLLEKVLVSMRDLEIKNDRFEIVKERIVRGLRNAEFRQPYHQVSGYSRWLSSDKGWINEQLLAEIEHITADEVRSFFPHLLRQLHIEVFVHGNLYKEDALKVSDLIESTLRPRQLPPSQWPIRRSLILPEGSNYVYKRMLMDPANVNHCIEYLLYVGSNEDRALRAKVLLLAQMTDEPAFDQLRTKEQLGYVVFSGSAIYNDWLGYRLLIQSEKSPEYLEKRIESFLRSFEKKLAEMTEDAFEALKRSLINKRLESLKNLTQETQRFLGHIMTERYDFEQVDREVEHIRPLTIDEMRAFFAYYIAPSSPTRAKIAVHMTAKAASKASATPTPDEQRSRLFELVLQFLKTHDIAAEIKKLEPRFAGLDLTTGDASQIAKAIGAYLFEDEGLEQEKVEAILKEGIAILESGALGPVATPADGDDSSQKEPVLITDVQQWKASLAAGPGPRPVVDLVEFEDAEPKL